MSPRNPSELQRLHEEALNDERTLLLNLMKRNIVPPSSNYADKGLKAAKEAMLRRVRVIEQELGIVSQPYNSAEFGR